MIDQDVRWDESIIIVMAERSGSNLLTSVLDSHSQISAPAPTHILEHLVPELWRYGDLEIDAHWERLVADLYGLWQTKLSLWSATLDRESLLRARPRSMASLVRAVFGQEAALHGKSRVVLRERHLQRWFAFANNAFPGAKFIHLVRDPRDSAWSWVQLRRRGFRFEHALRDWNADMRFSAQLHQQMAPQGRSVICRYEDLVTDPVAAIDRLCTFLSLAYEPDMLDFHRRTRARGNAAANPAWANLDKPIMSSKVGAYLSGLDDEQLREVEQVCGDTMAYFGYRPRFRRRPPAYDGPASEAVRISPAEHRRRQRRWEQIETIRSRLLCATTAPGERPPGGEPPDELPVNDAAPDDPSPDP